MCSYNAVNGVPSCANTFLLQDVLRDHWGFGADRWVTADCDAVLTAYTPHNYTGDPVQVAADALLAGTDVDCGIFFSIFLPDALARGLVTTADLKQALVRQYASLVRYVTFCFHPYTGTITQLWTLQARILRPARIPTLPPARVDRRQHPRCSAARAHRSRRGHRPAQEGRHAPAREKCYEDRTGRPVGQRHHCDAGELLRRRAVPHQPIPRCTGGWV